MSITRQQITNVIDWAMDRGILTNGTPVSQAAKGLEEYVETLQAIVASDGQLTSAVQDGIGDVLVTLIILARMLGTDIGTCLDMAIREISDRDGQMEGGFFVKNYGGTDD